MSTPSRILVVGSCRPKMLRARQSLHLSNPHCYWCGVITLASDISQSAQGILDDDTATLDHLLHARLRGDDKRQQVVLACYACNQLRARLNAYTHKRWPLSFAQITYLDSARSQYALRLAASTAFPPGASLLAAEYALAYANLTSTSAILASPSTPVFELPLLLSRLAAFSLLPALLT